MFHEFEVVVILGNQFWSIATVENQIGRTHATEGGESGEDVVA